jgi:proprotein convertase subtilisin/kexin type 5
VTAGWKLKADGTACECLHFFFLDNNACTPCSFRCASCSTTATTCLSCLFPLTLVSGSCVCPTAKTLYFSGGTNGPYCTACVPECMTCSTLTVCASCVTTFTLNTTTNVCECQGAFYKQIYPSVICKACFTNCATCTFRTVCLTCVANYELRSDLPLCQCKPFFW